MERRKGEIHYYSEMEVVRLTTTKPSTPDTTDEPTKAEKLKAKVALKARTALRQNIFGFIVVIASIVAMVVLMILGLALDNPKFQFPKAMSILVTIFVIGIFTWPTINAVRLRKNGGMWPRLAVVIAAVLGSLMLPWWLNFTVLNGSELAQNAWKFLGVFQAIAMFLLIALAAILIEKHTKDSDELVEARGDLKETDEAIVETGGNIRASEALVASAEPRITPLEQKVERKKTALEAAEQAQQAAEEACSKSQLEQHNSEKGKLEKKLKKLGEALDKTFTDPIKPGLAARDALKAKRAGIQAETAAAEEAIDTIDQALKSKAVLDEAKRLTQNLKSAKSALNDAKKAKEAADATLASANLALSEARQAVETHKGAKEELEKEKERLVELISSAEKSAKLVWRDTLFLPMLCLVFALVFSASWYGSVLVERF